MMIEIGDNLKSFLEGLICFAFLVGYLIFIYKLIK